MSHLKQELEPVVFVKKPSNCKPTEKKIVVGDMTLKKIENEEIKIPCMTKEMIDVIRNARTSQNLTQKQLAQKCCLSETDIADHEKVGTVINNQKLQKIRKALNISIKKPKVEKQCE